MNNDIWNKYFLELSPIFETIKLASFNSTQLNDWPDLEFLNTQFKESGLKLKAVQQTDKSQYFIDSYESRIFLKNELQTRLKNWHDYFNAMVWLSFPKTKSVLNKIHYKAAKKRSSGSNRSAIENAITLFDECGIIIISDKPELLEMIRNHQWKDLFYTHKYCFEKHIKCIVFGHAIYEKSLSPYIGMTAHALLIQNNDMIKNNQPDLNIIDTHIEKQWGDSHISTTDSFHPFPLLGVPGWYHENEKKSFYENKDYFRPIK